MTTGLAARAVAAFAHVGRKAEGELLSRGETVALDIDSAMLMRGVDRFGHFEREPRARDFYDQEAPRPYGRFMAMRYPILFRGAVPPPLSDHAATEWSAGRDLTA